MNEQDDLERTLARWLVTEALDPAPAGRFEQVIATTRDRRPRSALFAGFGSAWVQTGWSDAAPRISFRVVAVLALLLVAIAAGAVIVGGQRTRLPAVVPAANGLLAYSSRGDIYVGNPATGETTAVVTGSEIDSGPIFSPDGTRIAFVRGDRWTQDAGIIVVRTDGSDEREAMPTGFSKRGTDFTWTPDGASLLVNHDSAPFTTPYFDGELSLLDASGVAEPRLLTPPLPIGPGGPYFRYTDQVAPMFRPPNGDMILSHGSDATVPTTVGGGGINLWDADLENHTLLEPDALKGFTPYRISPWGLWWSPDGSMIAFEVGGNPAVDGFYLMKADGSDVKRREVDGGPLAWSPDGTELAFQRCRTSAVGDVAVIVILDVATGAERVLESTTVQTKKEGAEHTPPSEIADEPLCGFYQGPNGRAWDYEGWSWSPDGRSIVMLERRGTRPLVIDVQTGVAAALPWKADSAPSWQRTLPASRE